MKTEFKNILPFILKKIEKGATGVKIKKKHFDGFLLTQEHSGLILFTPYHFPTRSPPHIVHGETFHDLCSSSLIVNF
jgi:hypothetical protein